MNGRGKSDRPIVPEKSAKMSYLEFFQKHAKWMKGRGLARENGEEMTLPLAASAKQADRTPSRIGGGRKADPEGLSQALERIRQAARRDKELKFTSIWHHVYNVPRLREAYFALK